MALVGEGGMALVGDKQGKGKGRELSQQQRLSTEFVESLSNCGIKNPSRDWNDVKAVDFRTDKEKIKCARSFFKLVDPALRNTLGAHHLEPSNPMPTITTNGQNKCYNKTEEGKEIHHQLSQRIKERLEKDTKSDVKLDEQVKKFVTNIEEWFDFKFKASELPIQGYASREQLEKTHCWSGICDAIGVKEDGTVIVVEWKCCEKVDEFWNTAKFSEKLYQTIIYRWIIKALWKDSYENDDLEVDILIVPIPPNNFDGSDPRICIDLKCRELEKNGFFHKFTWTAQKPRGGGNSPRCEQETDKVKTENPRDRSMTEEEVRDLLTTLLFIIAVFWRTFCYEDKESLSDVLQEGPPYTKCVSLVKKHSPQLQSVPETVSTIEEQSAAKVEKPACLCNGKSNCTSKEGIGKCVCNANRRKCTDDCNYDKKCTNRVGCSCAGDKKCTHSTGKGKCDCKARGQNCGDQCRCYKDKCKNRVRWKLFCERVKQNLSKVLQKGSPDIKYASLPIKYLPQLESVSEIIKQESAVKAEGEEYSRKHKTILEPPNPPYVEEIKEVRKTIAVKQHLSGRTPTELVLLKGQGKDSSYKVYFTRPEIIKQESTVEAEEEVHSRKVMTPDGDCGNKMKPILEPPILPYAEEIKEVRDPIAVKQEEQIRQMLDRQHLSGRTPTNSNRTAEMSEIIKQDSTVKAEGEEYSRKHKTPDGDCGNKMKPILEPPLPPYVEEIKEVGDPIAVKQEEQIRQMFDRQHLFGRTPTNSNRTAEMSEMIKQESTVKAEEKVHSRKHKTPDGDCGNKMKSILEPPIPPYLEEIKEVRDPIPVKQEEQIRQLPDRQHLSGRTPTNSYRTAEMSEIIKQESTVKAEEEDYSRKHKTPDGDCGNKMKSILEPPIPPYAKEIKEVRKPIAVKQEEQIRQMLDWPHFFGWAPTDSNRTAKMSEIIKQESTVKAEGEDHSRKHKTPDGDCGNKLNPILEPSIPPYVEEIKEVRKPIPVKQEEPLRQMFDRQHLFGRTPTDSNRTAKMSEIIKQESTVKAEGEEYSRKHKTPDGDCGNRMRIISEPFIPLYHAKEIKEERKPVAVKQQEPIRQMPDRPHLSGRTQPDSYRAAEMYDTRNAAVGRVTQMPDLQHHIARTPVHWYYTPEEALQLHSSNIQPGISAAEMVYRESAELEPYHFIVEYTLNIYKPQPKPDDHLPTLTPQDFATMKLKRLSRYASH